MAPLLFVWDMYREAGRLTVRFLTTSVDTAPPSLACPPCLDPSEASVPRGSPSTTMGSSCRLVQAKGLLETAGPPLPGDSPAFGLSKLTDLREGLPAGGSIGLEKLTELRPGSESFSTGDDSFVFMAPPECCGGSGGGSKTAESRVWAPPLKVLGPT
jgi:hypothetical protein